APDPPSMSLLPVEPRLLRLQRLACCERFVMRPEQRRTDRSDGTGNGLIGTAAIVAGRTISLADLAGCALNPAIQLVRSGRPSQIEIREPDYLTAHVIVHGCSDTNRRDRSECQGSDECAGEMFHMSSSFPGNPGEAQTTAPRGERHRCVTPSFCFSSPTKVLAVGTCHAFIAREHADAVARAG